jgi:hypothetical protein
MQIKKFLSKNKHLFLVFILFLTMISIMQFTVPEIIGYDGWLHIKSADLIRNNGFTKQFPYTTESILSQNYADTQFLFRVLLIPFTWLGLINGAKLASILFATLAFTFFYWYLKKNSINYPLFWTTIYAISSVNLMYRFLLPRAMPLAIISLILTLYFIDKKMYKSLLITSLLFTWLYHGFIIQLLIITIYLIINSIINKRLDLKLILYPLAGIALAIIINPYFPNNIQLLYTQIFKVNLLGNLYNVEWKPWNIKELLTFNYLLFIISITTIITLIKNKKLQKKPLVFLTLSIIFLIAMIKTRRMQEYYAPFTILFASFSLNSHTSKFKTKRALRYISTIGLILIAIFSLIHLNTYIKNNHILPWYKDGAEWLENNVPKDSEVFINGYTFNYLFLKNSDLRYTHGIDLTYSYLYNKDNLNRYISVLQGKDPGYNIIIEDYNSDYVFVGKLKQDLKLFEYIIKYGDDFELLYEDESVGILKVLK